MKVTVDANVLVRSVVRDDEKQADSADKVLKEVSLISISLPCLCVFVWILRRVYGFDNSDIALAIRALVATEKITMNRPAVEMGLLLLDAGGDFSDGAIAFDGMWLGGELFVSFDKKAVSLLKKNKQAARVLT